VKRARLTVGSREVRKVDMALAGEGRVVAAATVLEGVALALAREADVARVADIDGWRREVMEGR
jgi:hypothetical protein